MQQPMALNGTKMMLHTVPAPKKAPTQRRF
jgi:hypothetical protein